MIGNKEVLAAIVGVLYALATQFLPIPDAFKPAIGIIGLGGALIFGVW